VLNQSYKDIEIIVVDDASTAENKSKLMALSCFSHASVKLVSLYKNSGVSVATNAAFMHSSGEYIALLGDDDYWVDADKIKKQLSIIDAPDKGVIGVVGTWWKELDADGGLVCRDPVSPRNWKSKLLAGGGVICGSTPLILRKAWVDAGGMDEKMPRGTDSDLFRRIILRNYNAIILKEYTTVVDVGHGGSRMTSLRSKENLRKALLSHSRNLKKYFLVYLLYPGALVKRLLSILKVSYYYLRA